MDKINDLWTWDKIYKDMTTKYGNRVFDTDTTSIAGNKSKWASNVVENIYKIKRSNLTEKACHFSYIKFAIKKSGELVGIVGGKSQFHHNNPSDVAFYDINTEKEQKEAAKFMLENKIAWCEEKIIILVNELDDDSSSDAFTNEKILQRDYNLFG